MPATSRQESPQARHELPQNVQTGTPAHGHAKCYSPIARRSSAGWLPCEGNEGSPSRTADPGNRNRSGTVIMPGQDCARQGISKAVSKAAVAQREIPVIFMQAKSDGVLDGLS